MRFCEYCGAPLEDGQLCTCPQAQQQQQEPPTTQPESAPVEQTPPQQPATPPEEQGYSYGQSQGDQTTPEEQQPEPMSQPSEPSGQPPEYNYQQPGADTQQNSYGYQQQPSGYDYQQPGPQQQSGYGYQQQPGGYGYQPQGGQGQPGSQNAQQFAQMGRQVRDTTVHAAKSLKPFFAQYWASPVQAIRTAVAEKNLTVAVTLSVIRVVVVIALLWNVVGQVAGSIRSTIGPLSSLGNLMGSSSVMTVRGNPLGSILFGLIIAVVGMALFTLVLFALTRIFKSGGSILDMYIANSANGGVTTVVLFLAFVCAFFSLNVAVGLVVLACFTAVVCGSLSAQAVCGDQSSGMFWLCYLGGMLVILAVSWWIVPPCVIQTVGGITLTLDGSSITIREFLERFLSNGLAGLFSQLFY
ncbi:hypothetical protein B5F12_03505 [Pseudoflavonifractor sp. An176]|uniref:hypothetical protein n=1 Tax=Pseudoflavonifractor sp. An176 TaxID=1965572 RepID=UPI000B377430|nr:hypothetical protein [Pseudoflavonifractor sp. An176]OUP65073.1 hypothetical protein B5F12_03505 [Pseudoflavonifractor sp. An176]